MGNIFRKKRNLEEEIKLLEIKNKELEKRVEYFEKLQLTGQQQRIKLSKENIQKYVSKFLDNEEINIDYLPDFVERKIYENTFNILINLVDHVFENTTLSLLNHNIQFTVMPITEL